MKNESIGLTSLKARALYLAESFNLKTIELTQKFTEQPYLVKAGQSGYAVLFRYGVAVLFNLKPVEETAFIEGLKTCFMKPLETPVIEECDVAATNDDFEGVRNGIVTLNGIIPAKLQILAITLSKSVVLERYEKMAASVFETVEPLASQLATGNINTSSHELIKQMGSILSIQHKMVGRIEISEKPDFLWEHVDMEKLYMRLEYEYDIRDRNTALERKFRLISDTLELLEDILKHKSSIRVEWYIVFLILFEIMFSLYTHFAG
jgi:uncharacterized Rmd1/YagE family protein